MVINQKLSAFSGGWWAIHKNVKEYVQTEQHKSLSPLPLSSLHSTAIPGSRKEKIESHLTPKL